MRARKGFVTQIAFELDAELDFAGEAGFDYVEILMDGPDRRERLAERADDVARRLEANGLDLLVHLPFPTDVGSPFEGVREGAVETQKACIETAAELGAEKGVLHPESRAWGVAWDDADVVPYVTDSVQELHEFGAERGFEICAENLFDNCFTIENFDVLLAETDASMTLDTGHARIEGFDASDTAAFVEEYPDRISHFHLNDTRGPSDEHLPFGAGNIDFEAIFDALPDDWAGTLSIEAATDSFDYLERSKADLDALV